MGVNIDLHIYDYEKLIGDIVELGAEGNLLSKILVECGHIIGNKYILLNNELGEEDSPYYNVSSLIDSAFNIKDSFDIFLDTGESGISWVDLDEVAEKLGITLQDET